MDRLSRQAFAVPSPYFICFEYFYPRGFPLSSGRSIKPMLLFIGDKY
jgi:hypothetical protein